MREACACGSLSRRNIVQIYDVAETPSTDTGATPEPAITMPLASRKKTRESISNNTSSEHEKGE
jgi:hypothetical protein